MGTRLEQLQAAAKAKTAAGQPLVAQPIAAPVAVKTGTPTVGAVTAAVSQPKAAAAPVSGTTNSVKSASAMPATQSVVKPSVTAPTAAIGALAGVSAGMTKPTAPAAAAAPTAAVAQPNTNYVQQGGQTLNNLLYLKKSYESGKTGAASYAGQYYNQLDPNTAAAVKNMNAAQLEQYIAGMGNGSATSGQAVQQGTPAVATKDYNALAQAQYDRELAALLAGAQSQETELNRRYDYANNVTQDNRQLETATFNRNNAPTAWDGSTGYQAAQMDRNRSIEDHYTGEALKDNVAAAYSQANAFRGQAGNYLTTASNQLQTADQQLAMQEAGLTGVYKGQQTMQGAANAAQLTSQNIANQIAQIDLSTYPQQSALKLQQLQQQVQSGQISNDAAAYQLSELTNPNSTTNQVAALELAMKQIDASNYPEASKLQLEQLRKTVAEIGKTQPVSAYEQQMQSLDLQKAQLQLQQLAAEATPSQMTAEDYATNYIDKSVQRDKKGVITNLPQVQAQILQSGLADTEIAKLYVRYGIPLPAGYSGN